MDLCSCVKYDFPEGLRYLLQQSAKCNKDEPDIHSYYIYDAVRCDRLECIQVFIEHGCDLNGTHNDSPIFLVESVSMAKLLITNGVNINPDKEPSRYDDYVCEQQTTLFGSMCENLMCSEENEFDDKLLPYLVEQGCKPKCTGPRKYLEGLLRTKKFKLLEFFHDKLGFDIHEVNDDGQNLLFDVIDEPNIEGLKWLLEHGVQNIPNNEGRTPLQSAKYFESIWPSMEMWKIVELIEMYENIPTIKEPEIN